MSAKAIGEAILQAIQEALDDHDFSSTIEDAVETAMRDHDFSDVAEEAVSDALRDFDPLDNMDVGELVTSIQDTREFKALLAKLAGGDELTKRVQELEAKLELVARILCPPPAKPSEDEPKSHGLEGII